MMLPANGVRVYLALGATDMRKSIDGLSILVSRQMQLDPFAGHLFGFCNRSRTI
ncbi:IS66 family insertion sequence element accessory protein TnpB, partial [Solidesulfovibrio sp. C21]|uniref:IS66 family insertion sequence element accessory protein TnpB n=1 Tax=Solidesulfovibrio sp. C21 TaxID=3398613 RepID=UPI0039FBB913